MTRSIVEPSARPGPDTAPVVQAVTVIMGTVIGLTFLFGFGNVLNLALRLGVPVWVAPLVAPAVDLSILGLLLGTRHLALHDATPLRPARRLLIFASLATLALNIADPLVTGAYGKAAFDAVGPFLLIGWAEVGPGLQQAISTISPSLGRTPATHLRRDPPQEPADQRGALADAHFDRPRRTVQRPKPSHGGRRSTSSGMTGRHAVRPATTRRPFHDQGGKRIDRLVVLFGGHRRGLNLFDHVVPPTALRAGFITHPHIISGQHGIGRH